MTPLRVRAIAGRLALAITALLVVACASGVTDSINAAQSVAGDLAGSSEPTRRQPVSVGPPSQPPEVRELTLILRGLRVVARDSGTDYNRRDWRHWIDADRDCQNTRAEVLIAESVAPVSFAPEDDGDKCRVISGEWVGPWTGAVFTDASEVDIDHHVPLGHAHESGGWSWNPQRKRAYANDLTHPASLQVTSAPVNRSKGKQPPDEWRPEESAAWCRYAADWISVKKTWDLTVTSAEVAVLEKMLATCDDNASWGLSGPPGG